MRIRNMLVAGIAALALVSCSSGGAAPEATQGEPEKPDKIIVRAWGDPWSTTLGDIPAKAFTDATGIEVEFDTTEYDVMDTTIRTAIQAGQRPPVDVHYTMEKSAYLAAAQGLTVPLDTDIVTNFDSLSVAGKPDEGTDYVTIYTYAVPLIYRTDLVDMPENPSWELLWDDSLEGLVFMNGTAAAMVFPVAEMLGIDPETESIDPVWDKLGELGNNVKSVGFDTQFIEGMTSGEIAAGAMLVGNAVELQNAGVPVEWVVPEEGVYLTGDSMFVPAGIPDNVAYWAQVFINYVIDAQLQSEWTPRVQVIPTNQEAVPSEEMLDDPAFPFTDEQIAQYALKPSARLQAETNDDWQARYMEVVQR